MATRVHLRFYEELNDFLPETQRKKRIQYTFEEGELTILDLLERLGVPACQVELVLADGASVDFAHALRQDEWISFYPVFESFDIRPMLRVRSYPLRKTRFVSGMRLRPLARYLRLCGFDTLLLNGRSLEKAARISEEQNRVLLIPETQPLPKGIVSHVRHLHEVKPRQQLLEIIEALDLVASVSPLTRCPSCNHAFPVFEGVVQAKPPESLFECLPPQCDGCGRRFPEGPHLQRVRRFLTYLLSPPRAPS